jgi:hypothetical protein
MQERIKSMPDEFQPATPKGPDPKWRYMWRVGPRPSNTRFKVLISHDPFHCRAKSESEWISWITPDHFSVSYAEL